MVIKHSHHQARRTRGGQHCKYYRSNHRRLASYPRMKLIIIHANKLKASTRHRGKPFYEAEESGRGSGGCVVRGWEKEVSGEAWRDLMCAPDPAKADEGDHP